MNPTHVPAPLLCTGVPLVEENIERFVVSSDYSVQRSFCENGSSKLVEFRRLMSTVGFLLGLRTMPADIGGYTFIQLFEQDKPAGTTSVAYSPLTLSKILRVATLVSALSRITPIIYLTSLLPFY